MAFGHLGAGGGESRDAALEYESLTRASAVTVGSTGARIVSGSQHLTLPTATNAANCTVAIKSAGVSAASGIQFFQTYVGTNGTLTSEFGLLCKYANPTTERYVRIGTDNLVRVYDSAGNQVGHASKHAISTTGMTHVAICYDYLSPAGSVPGGSAGSAARAYVTLWIDGNVQWDGLIAVASGTRLLTDSATMADMVWGEDLDAAVNRGVDVYLDDHDIDTMLVSGGLDSRYLPHVTARPVIQVVGSAGNPPTANGSHTAWTTVGGGAGDYQDVDEYPADGTHKITTTANSAKETYTSSAANPTDSADTIHSVQVRATARETGGAKVAFLALYRDASANESTLGFVNFGTSFVGQMRAGLNRPAGGDWVYTDFDLTAGVSNLQFGVQSASAGLVGTEVDNLTGPEIVKYEASLSCGRMWN